LASGGVNYRISGVGIGSGVINTAAFLALHQGTTSAPYLVTSYGITTGGVNCSYSINTARSPVLNCIGGWFLFSMDEAGVLASNLTTVNAGIANANGAPINTTADYWTSTSSCGSEASFKIKLGNSNTICSNNGQANSVRAIRQF